MSLRMEKFGSRAVWLKHRGGIGGSDAAAVLGLSPWKTNTELWEIKTKRKKPEPISDNPAVKYGTEAEKYLRDLFALDFPEFDVEYVPGNIWLNDDFPFAHASLDGWLQEKDTGRKGVLEIKTTAITSGMVLEKWNGKIPDYYYCQVMHYLMVTGWDFAVLKAQLKFEFGGELERIETRHYHFERADCEDDIRMLQEEERKFWSCVETDTCPPLKLTF